MAIVQNLLSYGSDVTVTWTTLTTTGLIVGPPGGWYVTNNTRTIEYVIQNSVECGGTNSNTQTGVATAVITTKYRVPFSPVLTGQVEGGGGTTFDRIDLNINGNLVIRGRSGPGVTSNCIMVPGVVLYAVPGPYILPANSTTTFSLNFTTQDGLYHNNAFWKCQLNFS